MLSLSNPASTNEIVYEANGSHLLVTLRDCALEILNDEVALRELTRAAAEATRATVLQTCSHRFSPQGITVVVVLAESHASLHTYPESGVVFWDCFTCGSTCDPELSVAVLVDALKPTSLGKQVVFRE
jgi:S-adenosylmethionine decarboxylase proenzyme